MKRRVDALFGRRPDVEYFQGDTDYIRSYDEYERRTHPERFHVDEITWNDLDMERLFRRINLGLSMPGEQALWHWLRTPAADGAEWRARAGLIALMEDEGARRSAASALEGLRCARRAGPCAEAGPGRSYLPLCLLLALLPLAALVASIWLGKAGLLLALVCLALNGPAHELIKSRLQGEVERVGYMAALARAAARLQRRGDPRLRPYLDDALSGLPRLRSALRLGFAMPAEAGGSPLDLILACTMADLVAFEALRRVYRRQHDAVVALHGALGRLDAAISVASFRRALPHWCAPELDYAPNARPTLAAEALVHPLLDAPVPNDLALDGALLITGSNASGKSTCLRAVATGALLAQGLCTAPARLWRAPAFLVYTSMALRDDLAAGESYYVAEMRAIKRILDAAGGPRAVLCAVDEVLRGTNTVERIAASCEILRALAARGALVLAATHDIELTGLLAGFYGMAHFEERFEEGKMLFDYRLKPGGATSRNAIDLLALIGLDGSVVSAARARAEDYLLTGRWRASDGAALQEDEA